MPVLASGNNVKLTKPTVIDLSISYQRPSMPGSSIRAESKADETHADRPF
jgi:hypothetical protein